MNQARIENEKLNNEIREGATTIPKGSTLQANGSGSAGHLLRGDDDIVCSARKLAAVRKDDSELAIPSEHKGQVCFQSRWTALVGKSLDGEIFDGYDLAILRRSSSVV